MITNIGDHDYDNQFSFPSNHQHMLNINQTLIVCIVKLDFSTISPCINLLVPFTFNSSHTFKKVLWIHHSLTHTKNSSDGVNNPGKKPHGLEKYTPPMNCSQGKRWAPPRLGRLEGKSSWNCCWGCWHQPGNSEDFLNFIFVFKIRNNWK